MYTALFRFVCLDDCDDSCDDACNTDCTLCDDGCLDGYDFISPSLSCNCVVAKPASFYAEAYPHADTDSDTRHKAQTDSHFEPALSTCFGGPPFVWCGSDLAGVTAAAMTPVMLNCTYKDLEALGRGCLPLSARFNAISHTLRVSTDIFVP